MKIRSLLTLASLVLSFAVLALTNTGCIVVAAGAGAGAVAWARGDLETTLDSNLEQSTKASLKAIDSLKLVKISDKQDAMNAVLVARNAEDKRIQIKLSSQGERHTKVSIRVGVFGDERISLSILEKIKAEL